MTSRIPTRPIFRGHPVETCYLVNQTPYPGKPTPLQRMGYPDWVKSLTKPELGEVSHIAFFRSDNYGSSWNCARHSSQELEDDDGQCSAIHAYTMLDLTDTLCGTLSLEALIQMTKLPLFFHSSRLEGRPIVGWRSVCRKKEKTSTETSSSDLFVPILFNPGKPENSIEWHALNTQLPRNSVSVFGTEWSAIAFQYRLQDTIENSKRLGYFHFEGLRPAS